MFVTAAPVSASFVVVPARHWPSWLTLAAATAGAIVIFNVDAAGGLPHLVAEMLLQSTPGELRVLPTLPALWPAGRVTGLRARGGSPSTN